MCAGKSRIQGFAVGRARARAQRDRLFPQIELGVRVEEAQPSSGETELPLRGEDETMLLFLSIHSPTQFLKACTEKHTQTQSQPNIHNHRGAAYTYENPDLPGYRPICRTVPVVLALAAISPKFNISPYSDVIILLVTCATHLSGSFYM